MTNQKWYVYLTGCAIGYCLGFISPHSHGWQTIQGFCLFFVMGDFIFSMLHRAKPRSKR